MLVRIMLGRALGSDTVGVSAAAVGAEAQKRGLSPVENDVPVEYVVSYVAACVPPAVNYEEL